MLRSWRWTRSRADLPWLFVTVSSSSHSPGWSGVNVPTLAVETSVPPIAEPNAAVVTRHSNWSALSLPPV